MLSKRSDLRMTAALFFVHKLFSFHILLATEKLFQSCDLTYAAVVVSATFRSSTVPTPSLGRQMVSK